MITVEYTVIWWIWKLLGWSLRHGRPGQDPIHAGGRSHIWRWTEGLGLLLVLLLLLLLLLLHHHRHPLLPEVMTQQLSAALGDHLSIKETLLTPKKRTQLHTYSKSQPVSCVWCTQNTLGIKEKTSNAFIIRKKEMPNSHYGNSFLTHYGGGCWGSRRGTSVLLRARGQKQLPRWLSGKESTCQAEEAASIPGLGRSLREGNGNPLQDFFLRNPMDREACWATVCGVSKESDTT